MTRSPDALSNPTCQLITDWHCTDDGEQGDEIICGQFAEWKTEDGLVICSDCRSTYDARDQGLMTYVGLKMTEAETTHRVSDLKEGK